MTFGMKSRHSVPVVAMMIARDTTQNCTLGSSLVRKEAGAPIRLMMPTVYTLHPMYRLSFRTAILTCWVSQDRKQPKT